MSRKGWDRLRPCAACQTMTLGRCACGVSLCGTYGPACPSKESGCPACQDKVAGNPEWHRRLRRRPGESSQEWSVRRSCTDKSRWETSKEAAVAAWSLNRHARPDGPRFNYYACEFCGGFHLTRRSAEEQLAIRARRRREGP